MYYSNEHLFQQESDTIMKILLVIVISIGVANAEFCFSESRLSDVNNCIDSLVSDVPPSCKGS